MLTKPLTFYECHIDRILESPHSKEFLYYLPLNLYAKSEYLEGQFSMYIEHRNKTYLIKGYLRLVEKLGTLLKPHNHYCIYIPTILYINPNQEYKEPLWKGYFRRLITKNAKMKSISIDIRGQARRSKVGGYWDKTNELAHEHRMLSQDIDSYFYSKYGMSADDWREFNILIPQRMSMMVKAASMLADDFKKMAEACKNIKIELPWKK